MFLFNSPDNTITNSILWNNHNHAGGIGKEVIYMRCTTMHDSWCRNSSISMTHSVAQEYLEGASQYILDQNDLIPLSHSPFVEEPSEGDDGVWGSDDDVLPEVRDGSGCIDAGDNTALPADALDLDGDKDTSEALPYDLLLNERVVGDAVDLGAYEAQ